MYIDTDRTDANGYVLGVRAHDATLVGFSYAMDQRLELRLHRVDGTFVRVRLNDVHRFGATDFRTPAIVDGIFAWNPSDTPALARVPPDGAWNVFLGGELTGANLEREIRRAVEAKRFKWLVYVDCSYGGMFAALCNGIQVEEEALPDAAGRPGEPQAGNGAP